MYAEMNMGKGVAIPPGKEAPFGSPWREIPSQDRSYGLPIDCLGNPAGRSNWQAISNDGAIHSQPLEQQNYNTVFHNTSGIRQVCVPGIGSNSSGNRNSSFHQMDEPCMQQPLNSRDEFWNSSWEQLLALMKAPPAVPENRIANKSTLATDMYARIPNSNNSSPIPPLMKVPYAVEDSRIASRNMNVVDQHMMPISYSQAGSNLMQSMMKAPLTAFQDKMANKSLSTHGHVVTNRHSLESNKLMQPNFTSSMSSNQSSYLASNQRSNNSLSPVVQDGFPVLYQPHYNLNYKDVDAASSITRYSQFAPATPQPTKKAQNLQYSPMLNLSLHRNLNQDKDQQETSAVTSVTNTSQFAPVTPQPAKKSENHRYSATLDLFMDQNQTLNKVQQEILAGSTTEKPSEHDCQEVIQNIVDSSSATIGTSFKERNTSDNGENPNFNLSNTTPEKAPRRKKHRPKVIVENRPPRNQKLAKTKTGPDGHPVPKRKYVRKNKLNATDTPQPDVAKKCKDSTDKSSSKSCRRALNFEQEDSSIDKTKVVSQQETQNPTQVKICHNFNAQETGQHIGRNSGIGTNTASLSSQQNLMVERDKIGQFNSRLHPTMCQMQAEKSLQPNHPILGIHPVMREMETEKSYMSTHTGPNRAIEQCKTTVNDFCMSTQQLVYAGGVDQPLFQEITAPEKLERNRRQILQIITQKQRQREPDYIQSRGCKRDYCLTEEREGFGQPKSSISCKETFLNTLNSTNHSLYQSFSEMPKRKKIDSGCHITSSSIRYSARCTGGSSSEIQTYGYLDNHFMQVKKGLLNSDHESNSFNKSNGGICYSRNKVYTHSTSPQENVLKQPISSEVNTGQEKQAREGERVSFLSHVINSLNERVDPKHQTPPNKASSRTERVAAKIINSSYFTTAEKKDNEALILSKHTANNTGSHEKHKSIVSVNEIIDQLECLKLNTTKTQTMKDEQNALVPYKADGTIIPYEGFDALKKRKPRPKVDLDPETNRLWKLLMEKGVGEDEKQTDQQKAKWWEEERKVFRGRADSFIARMHLVQGDRRFSPWKGSVVDSVIGVFLTQNVTDHLSSSAFMSLAALFPPQSRRRNNTSANNKPSVLVKEPEIRILETSQNVKMHEKFRNQAIHVRTPSESVDQQRHNLASVDGFQQPVRANDWRLEEIISSQDSTKSSNLHDCEAVQFFSESDPKANHLTNGSQSASSYSSAPFIVEEMENIIRFQGFLRHKLENPNNETATKRHLHLQNAEAHKQEQLDQVNINSFTTVKYPLDLNRPQLQVPITSSRNCQVSIVGDIGLSEANSYSMLRKQQSISLHLNASGVNRVEDLAVTRKSIGQEIQRETVSLLNRQESPYVANKKHSAEEKNNTQIALQNHHDQSSTSNNQQDGIMSSLFRCKSGKEHFNRQIKGVESAASAQDLPDHAYDVQKSISVTEKGIYVQNKAESNIKEQDSSYAEAPSRTKISAPKAKGRKKETEGKTAFDWDSLRREVQSNGNQRERSCNTMDSIDYEAFQHADVNEISKAIKERGMNNMLADRMKDFLNRLIRDHGSIDLEWLRDVPPDKAKDYLLSIRGLGLKSVECIRLLTLHQHAFPVDTNVGRIAVRLGWVPLQPLPESLQLHLLELYPILESIQKYLWPRLCNLDQRTLYELHYQLITFGKVFCTKSKPNCNACPMRGECRHFASAFASSRLALPGPEEKSIVTSDIPIETSGIPTIVAGSIPLYSLQEVSPKEVTSEHGKCEPIVEEPTTPEPESRDISDTDIEDGLYEDPDEIPTIRLNVEEFTQNLQNFMQENMELQEGDMSKAIVALNPKVASIPTPKLKNVSRLRTEHQVYQLSDTHPLLKELDKREPDDPSPYLLAIWTPGETANSIQPPEWSCSSHESENLCNEKTCFTCNSIREADSNTVRGTLLIPCRTAMRGSFPLNGTYFQVNEVFADHNSSLNPIDVPTAWIWNLPRRTVYFGTSVSTIFKGMSTEEIQYCFWRGFVCVRGFDIKTRAPRPLIARLHFSASKQANKSRKERDNAQNN